LTPLYDEFRVISYDIRNRGRSDAVPQDGQVGLPIELDDIESVCREFNLDSFSLIGWSYLGAEVALYAARQPPGLRRVVMICPIPPRELPPSERMANYQRQFSEAVARFEAWHASASDKTEIDPVDVARSFYDATTPLAMGDPGSYANRRSDPSVHPNEWPDHMRDALLRVGETVDPAGYDYRSMCAEVQIPVLVVHGDADRIPLQGSREWVESFPNASLMRLQGVGHFPFVEAPGQLFPALTTFLSGP
jgi:pimeloyl-ACP methyl ester carboxylesterase